MARTEILDTKMHGRDEITAAFVVEGEQTALVETGPKSTLANVTGGLERLGIERLDHIVVTHIHLDHAGAAGTLAARFPDAVVWVHAVGAPHLIDPSKLWTSAARIYGDEMDELWGGIDPTPEDRIRVLADGDKIDLGGRTLQAVDTPGHAGHHHAYLDSETGAVFVGDALGVRLGDVGRVRPATPPPEFNLEQAVASIDKIRALRPTALWLTHFGPAAGPIDETCDEAIDALRTWESWVGAAREETNDLDRAAELVRERVRAELETSLTPGQIDRMEHTTSYRMNTWGYMRYFDKLER